MVSWLFRATRSDVSRMKKNLKKMKDNAAIIEQSLNEIRSDIADLESIISSHSQDPTDNQPSPDRNSISPSPSDSPLRTSSSQKPTAYVLDFFGQMIREGTAVYVMNKGKYKERHGTVLKINYAKDRVTIELKSGHVTHRMAKNLRVINDN